MHVTTWSEQRIADFKGCAAVVIGALEGRPLSLWQRDALAGASRAASCDFFTLAWHEMCAAFAPVGTYNDSGCKDPKGSDADLLDRLQQLVL
jgi:hypothetical protein